MLEFPVYSIKYYHTPIKKESIIMFSYAKNTLIASILISSITTANMPWGGFKPFLCKYFIETGTFTGSGIDQALAAGFPIIHSVELDYRLAHEAGKRFSSNQNIHVWHGDSGSVLFYLTKDIDEPMTFWLDGHNGAYNPHGENTPILRELEEIKKHHIKTHTILIDDMHCAGGPLFDFITKEQIIGKIKEINPAYEITYVAGGDDAEYPNNIMVARVRYN
jgi:hypothetical protein